MLRHSSGGASPDPAGARGGRGGCHCGVRTRRVRASRPSSAALRRTEVNLLRNDAPTVGGVEPGSRGGSRHGGEPPREPTSGSVRSVPRRGRTCGRSGTPHARDTPWQRQRQAGNVLCVTKPATREQSRRQARGARARASGHGGGGGGGGARRRGGGRDRAGPTPPPLSAIPTLTRRGRGTWMGRAVARRASLRHTDAAGAATQSRTHTHARAPADSRSCGPPRAELSGPRARAR